MTIQRIWHGWTLPENADSYLELLRREVLPGIEAMAIPGYRGIELLRRDRGAEVEFITIMTFDSIDSVIAFRGEDYRSAHVPAAARELLQRWDETSAHYEVLESRTDEGQTVRSDSGSSATMEEIERAMRNPSGR